MEVGATAVTQATARRYFAAWTNRRTAETASLLDPDFRFTAGEMVVTGANAFMAAASFPPDATVTLIAEAYQHGTGFQMYDATRRGTTVRIVDQLTVAAGRLTASTVVADSAGFAAFLRA